MVVILLILAVVFFVLAGCRVGKKHVDVEWFGLACLVAAWAWPVLTR